MDPSLTENKHRLTSPDLEQEKEGVKEKADRAWLDGYSSSRNPMEGPFGGLIRMVKTRPGVMVFIAFCVSLLVLLTFLNPN
jgi:hypothetical protein